MDTTDMRYKPIGTTQRGQCPECGSTGFTMSRIVGGVVWNCFRASCGNKGRSSHITTEDMKALKSGSVSPTLDQSLSQLPPFELPEYITWDTRLQQYVDQREPRRLVWVIQNFRGTGGIISAVGRKYANGKFGPKWMAYGPTEYPYVARNALDRGDDTTSNGENAVVVEDVISADEVTRFLDDTDGVALLGTDLSEYAIDVLSEYDKIIVCLDKDAAMKALKISKTIAFRTGKPVQVYVPNDDLKYTKADDIRNLRKMMSGDRFTIEKENA